MRVAKRDVLKAQGRDVIIGEYQKELRVPVLAKWGEFSYKMVHISGIVMVIVRPNQILPS